MKPSETIKLIDQAFTYVKTYIAGLETQPTYVSDEHIENLSRLTGPMSEKGCAPEETLAQLAHIGGAATIPSPGGRYFGFVNGGTLPVGLAARLLADAWDQNAALYVMSPVAGELEQACETWLVDLLGLPKNTVAGFVGGTSMANLSAFVVARNELLNRQGWDVRQNGLNGAPPLRVIVSDTAHSSVRKALSLIGIGERSIETVPTDSQGRMRVDKLPKLGKDCLISLQAGDVNSGAFDRFSEICPLASEAGAWVHVDGAFGLWAAASPRTVHLTHGLALADSWAGDAHKTLNAPYDNGIVFCKHEEAYRQAMSAQAGYLQYSENRDGMALVPDMSRRAQAIELWAILHSLGRTGIAKLVEQLCDRTQQLRQGLRASGIEIINDVEFTQIIIALDTDAHTQTMLEKIQQSGEIWCGGSTFKGRDVIRISICSWATTRKDIERTIAVLKECSR